MKKLATLFFVLTSLYSSAQIDYGLQGLIPTDSCDLDNSCQRMSIDTLNINNNWVIGSTIKPFFGQANSLPNAIMTDSINPYSSNNWSFFDLTFNAWDGSGLPMNMYIQFDHKFETDTLVDGGFITVSYDSGQTWMNVINDSSCIACYYNWPYINSQNLYTNNDTLMNGNFGFSGTSNWKTTTMQWIWIMLVNKWQSLDRFIVRFNFISDNNQTNKDGWIIDNIVMGNIDLGSSVEEYSNQLDIKLFPNITSDYFNYKIEKNESIESIVITNVVGQNILTIKNPKSEEKIDVSKLPSGNYFVKFSAKGKQVVKKLIIN